VVRGSDGFMRSNCCAEVRSSTVLTAFFLCDGAKLITCLAHETKLSVVILEGRDAKGKPQ
jgi:hypothetical protein